jgi:CheY-like chemotaxis protein
VELANPWNKFLGRDLFDRAHKEDKHARSLCRAADSRRVGDRVITKAQGDMADTSLRNVIGSGNNNGGMATVLIVEDEEQVRVLAESYLREQGHVTLSAATKEQALAVLEVAKVDLLFVDVGLYDDRQVGLDLAKESVERLPELKVLYTTGQPVTDGMKALFVGKSALLPKPYTVEQLQAVLAIKFGFKPVNVPTTPSVLS